MDEEPSEKVETTLSEMESGERGAATDTAGETHEAAWSIEKPSEAVEAAAWSIEKPSEGDEAEAAWRIERASDAGTSEVSTQEE